MSLSFLRAIDRWVGSILLYTLALPVRALSRFFPSARDAKSRYVFLKLKGGGSLIIGMPSLLGLRHKYPQAEFVLVCAREAKVYAELTGVFDRFAVIDDTSFLALMTSGIAALRDCFRTQFCIDLEPNSWFASLFTMLTCAQQRMGLVKPEQPARGRAYNAAIPYNTTAPIYIYYDQICESLGAIPASVEECRATMRSLLPLPYATKKGETIALAAFTSDFAPERMMPQQTWGELLKQAYPQIPLNIMIFGSLRNKGRAQQLKDYLNKYLPAMQITNLAGSDSLAQTAARMVLCDEVWAIDSGLLHIARLLGVPTRSFWGPTMPAQRLRPIPSLSEQIRYRAFMCSPCTQAAIGSPCGGHNLCMISMAEESPDLRPAWIKK